MSQIVNRDISIKSKQNEIMTDDIKKKFIKAGTVGITGLTFLNANVEKLAILEKALVNGLANLVFGNSSICFLGIFPIPNAVLISVGVIVLGYIALFFTGGSGAVKGGKK